MERNKYFGRRNFVSKVLALLALFIGFVSLSGWIFDVSLLKAVVPTMVAIKFNTALCIFVLSLVAYTFTKKNKSQNFILLYLFTAFVFFISFSTLIEYLTNLDFGLDQFFIKDSELSILKPGRMSFVSSIVISLTSISVFLRGKKSLLFLSNSLQVINLFVSALALLGYLYDASGLLSIFAYRSIAPQTVVAFILLNLSLLFSSDRSVILRPFLSPAVGGVAGRKLLGISTVLLVAVGFSVRQLTQHYKIDSSIDGVVVVILSLAFFSFFIWDIATRLNKMDFKLDEKRAALEKLNADLEMLVQQRTEDLQRSEEKYRDTISLAADGIFEADLNGVYTYVNQSGLQMLGYGQNELIGKTIMDIIPKEDIPKLTTVLDFHERSVDVVQLEWNLVRKDGSILPVEINSRTVKGDRIVAFVRDASLRKKAEANLQASEKKFRTVFEGAYDSILVTDEAGLITMVNKQLCKNFGYEPDELVGKPVETLIPERYRQRHVGNRNEFAKNAHSRPMGAGLDLFGLRSDGSEFAVDISLSPTMTDEGLRVTAIIRDIAERKKFEQQQKFLADMGKVLEESFDYNEKIERLAQLMASQIADSCIIKVIEHGELVYKASAINANEPFDEFNTIAKKLILPGALGSLQVLNTGRPVFIEDVENQILSDPGLNPEIKEALRKIGALSYGVFPLILQGRVVGTLVLAMNHKNKKITMEDRRFLQIVSSRCAVALENARLHKYSHLAEVVTNNLPSMIAYWDKNQICQFANKVYLDWFGVAPENLIGKSMMDLLGPDLYQKNKVYIDGALRGEVQKFERDLTLKSTGQIRHTNALYIPDILKGEVIGFFVLVVDVTEIKKAELEALSQKEIAEKAVQTREDVLAVVSHDLKNPLATVSLTADFLTQEKSIPWETVRECGVRVQRSVKQMQLLISDLLDFAKMESSTFSVDLSSENLNDIITFVVDSFKEQAEKKDITLKINVPHDMNIILCDPRRIVQVLSNLIGNSLKFTPSKGEILISATAQGEDALISVKDTGSGMPPEQLPKVFDRFWQAEKTKQQGSGLGLSIAQGIVLAHKGKIWVESEVGKGTTFFFTIPFAKPAENQIEITPETLHDVHILLVEDSEDNVMFVKMILEQAGASTAVASTGREALKACVKVQPDLIITDVEMPDISGIQLLSEVRTAIGKNIPVISFSAHSSGRRYEEIKKAGFDGNVTKPIKPEVLVNEVRRVLQDRNHPV